MRRALFNGFLLTKGGNDQWQKYPKINNTVHRS
jgi:hypothetical protein